MQPVLVLGNITCDIIVSVDFIPKVEDDIIIHNQQMQLGGCAFNVAHLLRLHQVDCTLVSVVGTGVYGDFIKQSLKQLGYKHRLFADAAHGCCYCLVDNNGERTFMAHHGVEYTFKKEWLNPYKNVNYGYVYVCGLDLDETCGEAMLDYLEEAAIPVFFAGGPSVHKIAEAKMKRLEKLKPILHLNELEAKQLSGCDTIEVAIKQLHQRFQSIVIVTLGKRGCMAFDGSKLYEVEGILCNVVDTIGAGDAHASATMMGIAQGKDMEEVLRYANRVSAKVVEKSGATFSKAQFETLFL